MSRLLAKAATLAAACAALSAHAGGPLNLCGNTPVKYNKTVVLNYDQGNMGGRTKAQADAIVNTAIATWNNVSTASVTLQRGSDMPVDVTLANYNTYVGNSFSTFQDGLSPVVYDSDGSIIDAFFGTGANTSVIGFAGSAYSTCSYLEGRAVINGRISISDATMTTALTHEIGHLIGLDHTQLDSDQALAGSNYPLMYPIAYRTLSTLHEDDIAAITALYPDTNVNATYGQISGVFTQVAGTAIQGANIWAVETTTGKVYSVVSDYLKQGTGFFKLLLPPGTYNLRAGAIRSGFTGGSSVGPFSELSTDPSFVSPLYVGGSRIATVTFGNLTPTPVIVTAGCIGTVNWKIDGTGTLSGNCNGRTLTASKAGTGFGSVTTITPTSLLSCGAVCSASFANGTLVTLKATPDSGSVFTGWSGACSGTTACVVTMNSAQSVTATFAATYSGTLATRYRLYSNATLEHLYTTNLYEYQYLTNQVTPSCCGWSPEGPIYKIFSTDASFGGVSAVPYMRLYNPFSFQHHWTTDLNEYNYLGAVGWQQEGPDGYILPGPVAGAVPLYRVYINVAGGLHLWTTDASEVAYLTSVAGWTNEGISGYVLPLP